MSAVETLLTQENFLAGKTIKEKIRYAYYDNPTGITDKKIADILKEDEAVIRMTRNRPGFKETLQKINENPATFTLNASARNQVEKEYLEWRQVQSTIETKALELKEIVEAMHFLDLPKLIETWKTFFEIPSYNAQLYRRTREGKLWVDIEYTDITKHSPELAEQLLEQPEDVLKAASVAIDKMEVTTQFEGKHDEVRLRIHALPKTEQRRLRQIRSTDIGKLYESLVDIDQVSDVRPQATMARFECPSCGNIIPVLQLDTKFKEPHRCVCGRKGKFKLLGKPDFEDAASATVREPLSEVLGQTIERKTMRVMLVGSYLTNEEVMNRAGFGKQAKITYIPMDIPINLPSGGQSTRFDIILKAISFDVQDEYTFSLRFTKEEEETYHKTARADDFLGSFVSSCFPQHYGDDHVKTVLALMLVADNFEEGRKDERIHVLIAGDPGTGKSNNLIARMRDLAPICEHVVGKGASQAGLTARSDKKDEFTGQYTPEPGVLPKANKGIVIIDELDKLPLESQPCLNEATSNGTVTIAKAGSHFEMPAQVCLLGSANPTSGRYDRNMPIQNQLYNIEETVRDRCIVFPIFDIPERSRDELVADAILGRRICDRRFDDLFLKRFILFARARVKPVLREEEAEQIKRFFVDLRASNPSEVTIGTRQLPKLRALTLCSAKLRLRSQTAPEDFELAKWVLGEMLRAFGMRESNLHVRTETIIRNSRDIVVGVVRLLSEKASPVSMREVIVACREYNVTQAQAELAIQTALHVGDLMSPKPEYLVVNQ